MNDRRKLGAALALLAGCSSGTIEGGTGRAANPSGGSNGAVFAAAAPIELQQESRLVRLSHAQYANTLQELFGGTGRERSFAPDALNGFKFDTNSDLRVDARLGPEYRASAEEVAARVVSDASVFGRVVTCNASDSACPNQFIQSFGERAFRRPLTDGEVSRFRALFDAASELEEGGDPFRDGVQLVLEAMLQSPQFLYRAEISQGQVQNGRQVIDDWEMASRLSYFLYDSMPDAPLFQRARAGQLHTEDQIAAEVTRMLGDQRVSSKFISFHEQLWQFGRYAKIAPDTSAHKYLPDNFVDRLLEASDAFLADVIDDNGGLEQFLTAPYAFADSQLATIYGKSVSGETPARIDFDKGERQGFLMQAGFLAANAYAIKTDPIHRGLFIQRDILCRAIPDPPPEAATTPPPPSATPIVTTRDEVTLLTGQSYCPTCHGQINEPGFSFEEFDAVGRARTQDNGQDVDTAGAITLDGERVSFQDARDLVDALAQSEEARNCYVSRWVEFANGRELATVDVALRDRLAKEALSVKELVTELATSAEFRSRLEAGQ